MTKRDAWNRCDECGKFIPMSDFDDGAVRRLIYPDSYLTRETYETLCRTHSADGEQAERTNPIRPCSRLVVAASSLEQLRRL